METNITGVKAKKDKLIEEFEVTYLKLMNKLATNLTKYDDIVTEKAQKELQMMKTLSEIRSEVVSAYRGNSIDIMIKFVSATHLESLQGALDALKSSLMTDLLNSPDLMDFDLSEVVIDISVSEDVLLECLNNLNESKGCIIITHPCDPTVVICYLIWPCDMAVRITYLISRSSSLSCHMVIKGYFILGV